MTSVESRSIKLNQRIEKTLDWTKFLGYTALVLIPNSLVQVALYVLTVSQFPLLMGVLGFITGLVTGLTYLGGLGVTIALTVQDVQLRQIEKKTGQLLFYSSLKKYFVSGYVLAVIFALPALSTLAVAVTIFMQSIWPAAS